MKVIAFLFAAVLIGLLITLPTWLLWNWLMPSLFGLHTITYFQAMGIQTLCLCLFGVRFGGDSK